MAREMARLEEEMLSSGRDPTLKYNFTDNPLDRKSSSADASTSGADGQWQSPAPSRNSRQQPGEQPSSSSAQQQRPEQSTQPAVEEVASSSMEEAAWQSGQDGRAASGDSRPSLENQLAAWEEGLPHIGGVPPALTGSSSSSSQEADTSSDDGGPATPWVTSADPDASPSESGGYTRPPRPFNLTYVANTAILTLDEYTKAVEAAAAIRATLARGVPVEVHCEGDQQLSQGMALLAAAARQLQKRGGARVVLQVAQVLRRGALNEGHLRLIARSVKGLSVEASADIKVTALVNRDALGELLASRMKTPLAAGAPPPLCGIEVTGGEEVLGAVLRGLDVARRRLMKHKSDMSIALDVAAAITPAEGREVWKLACMRCPLDSPHILSWYTEQEERPAGSR